MKITAVITARNDNYGGNLLKRSTICLQNFISRYDEVIYVDWNSKDKSLLDEIKSNLIFKGNLLHIKVLKEDILQLNPMLLTIPIVEILGRNIGIRRATSDFIASTNIDIIANRPNLDTLDNNTMYVVPRRNISVPLSKMDPVKLGNLLINNVNSFTPSTDANDANGNPIHDKDDPWSLVVSCGDYQLAHRNLWYKIKGFEEEMIYRGCADSNIMKKGHIYGNTSKLFLEVFHLEHSYNHINLEDKVTLFNDKLKFVKNFIETTNKDTWGFFNYNFNTEIL
jgi:hypothetical protein